jgi:beta-glucanase (GH16 family)
MFWKIVRVPVMIVAAVAGIALVAVLMGKPLPTLWSRPQPIPASTPPTSTHAPTPAVTAGQFASTPSWSYDFAAPLDPKVFAPEVNGEGGGNDELQYYTATNAYTQGGKLVIEAKHEQYKGKQYTSARLTTKSSFTPTYGRIVWKGVTLPPGAGTWPALWLWPANDKYTVGDMKGAKNGLDDTLNGEIDVMEWVGSEPRAIYGSAHSYLNYPDHDPHTASQPIANASTSPHDYWLEWTPDRLTFGVDGASYYQLNKDAHWGPANWPYDQPYFLVMNVAMGGSWGGNVDPGFKSSAMKIDAVEYYQYNKR